MAAPTFAELFKEHAVAPFFVFQVFCVGLWCLDEYWYYSVFTLVMLVVFEITVVAQRLKNLGEFRAMSLPSIDVRVRRLGAWATIRSEDLLPGDLCYLAMEPAGEVELTVPCDLLLLAGSCIVNEAMVSGESTPLLKESVLEHRPGDDAGLTLDMAAADKSHVLFGGTRILQLTSPQPDVLQGFACPTGGGAGCFAHVLRTGFGTMQGDLVRTMMYSSERMSANNVESFIFIFFLLIFALAAAGYVLYHGLGDAERNRYKLLLECILIITSVVPPELPMELSLAVNNSLLALAKYAIFCMEPFRIPFAGKVDICCFDKTGTLTGENLVVQGVVTGGAGRVECSPAALPADTLLAIATCHSLFNVNGVLAGDPMERTALEFARGSMPRNDAVEAGDVAASILTRFPFSSALKRMSCLVRLGTGQHLVTAKGAPEVMLQFFQAVPTWYEQTFKDLALSGSRVIALGRKAVGQKLDVAGIRSFKREAAECDLEFVGFLVFRCPLKPDSKAAIRALKQSSHLVTMITGDNALTAISTAKELEMNDSERFLLFDLAKGALEAKVIEGGAVSDADPDLGDPLALARQYSVCLTGAAIDHFHAADGAFLERILPWVSIFARTSPSQKEYVLTTLKALGYVTLMCGDGTNDVGALKQAHIGVALLDGKPEDLKKIMEQMQRIQMKKRRAEAEQAKLKWQARMEEAKAARQDGRGPPPGFTAEALQRKMDEISAAADDETPMVKLGDASVAAPFTSKISTIESVCSIIRQGRCTLVTTIQMYKILALNSLISAYGLSVLNLAGIRYGDFQVTITGLLLSACFLFLTRSQPIQKLSKQRPQPNILNAYLLISVLLQFAIHVGTLVVVIAESYRYTFPYKLGHKTEFTPSLMNTAVYLLSLVMQVSTFVVNYQGRPFRESLYENKNLRNALLAVGGIAVVAAAELIPDFNEWLQLVPMPPAFRRRLLAALCFDFFGCLVVESVAHRCFFSNESKLVRP